MNARALRIIGLCLAVVPGCHARVHPPRAVVVHEGSGGVHLRVPVRRARSTAVPIGTQDPLAPGPTDWRVYAWLEVDPSVLPTLPSGPVVTLAVPADVAAALLPPSVLERLARRADGSRVVSGPSCEQVLTEGSPSQWDLVVRVGDGLLAQHLTH